MKSFDFLFFHESKIQPNNMACSGFATIMNKH